MIDKGRFRDINVRKRLMFRPPRPECNVMDYDILTIKNYQYDGPI